MKKTIIRKIGKVLELYSSFNAQQNGVYIGSVRSFMRFHGLKRKNICFI